MSALSDFLKSTQNLTLGQGQSALGAGAQEATGGINAAAPALNFLTQLTKGDQGDVSEAAQPQIDTITQQFDQIRNMISQQPRGGGKTTALAEAPFQKSGAIARTEGDLRTGSASSLGQLGTTLAGLGQGEQSIGAGLEGTAAATAASRPTWEQSFGSFAGGLESLI